MTNTNENLIQRKTLKPRKKGNVEYWDFLIDSYDGSMLSRNGEHLLDEPMPRYQAKQAAVDEWRKHGKAASLDAMMDVDDTETNSMADRREAKVMSSIDYKNSSLVNEDPSAEDVAILRDTFTKLLASMTSEEDIKQLCISTRQSETEHFLSDEHIALIEKHVGDAEIKTDKDCARLMGHYINEEKNFSVQYNRFKHGFRDKVKKVATR